MGGDVAVGGNEAAMHFSVRAILRLARRRGVLRSPRGHDQAVEYTSRHNDAL